MRALILVVIYAVMIGVAHADTEAGKLFEDGLALARDGKHEEACAKFEQSISKDPRQVGALMNLGQCNQRLGKIATALGFYQRAFDFAVEANLTGTKDQALGEINKIAPKVPVLVFKRSGTTLPGEKLVVDDLVVPAIRNEMPVDPGRHTVVLTAPGRLPYETRVDFDLQDRKVVTLPELELPKTKIVTRETPMRRTAGKIATFSGIGVLALGTGLIIYGKRDYDKLFEGPQPHCGTYTSADGKPICDAYGQSRSERDRNIVIGGSVIATVGLAASATGFALWMLSPKETTKTTLQPTGSPTSVGMILSGSF